jgi:hypothetical protein
MTELCARLQFPLHDVDRHGEKGFTRIEKGFCTAPTSAAMRNHFLRKLDIVTASRFMPSSMEMIQGFGGDPICAVTEAPMFLMGKTSPSIEDSLYARLRDDLEALRAKNETSNAAAVQRVADQYALNPVSLAMQVRLQIALIAVILNQI